MAEVMKPVQSRNSLQDLGSFFNLARTVMQIPVDRDKAKIVEEQLAQSKIGTQQKGEQLEQQKMATEQAGFQKGEREQFAGGYLTPTMKSKLTIERKMRPYTIEELRKLTPSQLQQVNPVQFKELKGGKENLVFMGNTFKLPSKKEEEERLLKGRKLTADIGKAEAQKEKSQLELERLKSGGMSPKELRRGKRQLSNAIDKSNALGITTVLEKFDDQFKKLGIKKGIKTTSDELEVDIPGIGAGGFIPTLISTKDAKKVRQLKSSLKNQLLKIRSGGAVSENEAERMIEELEGAGTDKEFVFALQLIRDTLQNAVDNTMRGYDAAVVESYSGDGKSFLDSPVFQFDKTAAPQQMVAEEKGPTQTQKKAGNLGSIDMLRQSLDEKDSAVGAK